MKTAALNIEVRLDDRAERISTLDQALSFVQRLVDEVGGFVDRRKRALQVERDGRLRLGHALLQIQPALSKAGLFHEFIAGLRMNQRTVQEMLRVTRQFSTGGVFDLRKVEAAIARVRSLLETAGGDAAIRAIVERHNPVALNTQHLRVLATWDAKALSALAGKAPDAHARALDVRENPNASCAAARPSAKPTHEAPTVSGLQVEHGDKVVWSAQLGRWMVEIGEVLYELHEYTRVRKGQTVTWPDGVTPAGYDDDDEDFDDDDEFGDDRVSDDGFDDDDDLGDEDAAFADDDEPLEDEEVEDRASNFTHATPSTTGDTDDEDDDDDSERHDGSPGRRVHGTDRAPLDAVAATGDHARSGRGASGQQLTFAGLFEAADGIARAMAALTTKLQHEPLISQRDLDAAERAVDDAKVAIAEARVRLTEERP